ncbi:helix-turn-helix domain-containing protein [Ruegeria sp. Alg231-54]|uniref:AraC family transcriptional regulator n=1 Tax=Ruegeria sp. Alg231-54 TaxID=1922221 RepID=UPI00131EEC02|nr:helix-turn-helix domain-containing protein [Ruegeria sp. Alg231-54]
MLSVDKFSIDLADADTLAGFYLQQTSTDTRFLQMNTGAAILEAQSIDLGDLCVMRVSGNGKHLWTDNMVSHEWRFAVLAQAEGSPKIGDQDIAKTTAHLLRPGQSSDLLTNGYYTTLEISFSQDFAQNYGWDCLPHQTAEIDYSVSKALSQVANRMFSGFSLASTPRLATSDTWDAQAAILDLLDVALHPWQRPDFDQTRAHGSRTSGHIVQETWKLLADNDYVIDTSVSALAQEIGVSKRSMFQAFKNQYGVGPRRFHELLRLNALRSCLYYAADGGNSVTSLANEHGFSELGRMAGKYRALFGELPSTTLSRRPI